MKGSFVVRSSLWLCAAAACAQGTSAAPVPYKNGQAGAAPVAAGSGGAAGSDQAGAAAGSAGLQAYESLPLFSFFVTSFKAMQELSNDANGFGGDLRFGKADGLSGADEICRQIAERVMAGSSRKGWRAFLSATKDAEGNPVHAIDRIGTGPWYDLQGRLVAENITNLAQTRPLGGQPEIIDDLPNEDAVPNHKPDGTDLDNHDVLTGSGPDGKLYNADWAATCRDWTSSVGADGKPRVGHSWTRMRSGSGDMGAGAGMDNWMSVHNEAGCAPGANLLGIGPPDPDVPTVGSGGGYGGIYCFALAP